MSNLDELTNFFIKILDEKADIYLDLTDIQIEFQKKVQNSLDEALFESSSDLGRLVNGCSVVGIKNEYPDFFSKENFPKSYELTGYSYKNIIIASEKTVPITSPQTEILIFPCLFHRQYDFSRKRTNYYDFVFKHRNENAPLVPKIPQYADIVSIFPPAYRKPLNLYLERDYRLDPKTKTFLY